MQEYLEVGQIVNTSGLKGLLKVIPYTDDKTRFEELTNLYIEEKGQRKEFAIESVRYVKNFVLLKLKGIDRIEDAEKVKGYYLTIDRKDAKELDEDTYFITDLLGLEVYTEEGKLLGILDDIFPTGSNDVYVVKDDLGKQILLPAIADVIQKVDLSQKKITVRLLKGLG